jgi:hypothetical protein
MSHGSASFSFVTRSAPLDAVQNQIVHMQRGDQLVLIPITGDAANDSGGRVLRLSGPTERETYDAEPFTLVRDHGKLVFAD